MKKFSKIIPVVLLILGLLLIPLGTRADFGDFSGDSDFGGGGDSGWDSGWDSSDWGGSSGSGEATLGDIVIFIVVMSLVIFAFVRDVRKSGKHLTKNTSDYQPKTIVFRDMKSYLSKDPSFSASQFKEKVSNLYVQFQNEWQNKDISPLRPYMTAAMFAQMDRQLDRYRQEHQTNHVDRIAVLSTDLLGWFEEGDTDSIVVRLYTRIVDYVTDDNTGAIVRGSNTKEKFMTYEWTLVRSSGVVTSGSSGTTSQTCPYCGARVDINHTAVCEYCDSVLTTDTFDWAVSNIRAISQRTK